MTPQLSDGSFTAPGAVDTSNGATGNTISFTLPHGLQTGDVVTYNAQIVNPATDFVDQRAHRRSPVRRDRRGQRHAPARRRLLGRPGRSPSATRSASAASSRESPGADGVSPGTTTFVALAAQPRDRRRRLLLRPERRHGGRRTRLRASATSSSWSTRTRSSCSTRSRCPRTRSSRSRSSRATCRTTPDTNVGTINKTNTLANGDPVTYHAPPTRSFGSAAVGLSVDGYGQPRRNADNTPIYANDSTIFLGSNPDSNGIFQTGHGYSTGDQITYTVTGGTAASRHNVFGVQVADGATRPTGSSASTSSGSSSPTASATRRAKAPTARPRPSTAPARLCDAHRPHAQRRVDGELHCDRVLHGRRCQRDLQLHREDGDLVHRRHRLRRHAGQRRARHRAEPGQRSR